MNEHDDLGSGDDLGPGADVLRQTIGALVDGATPPGVPSTPEQNLGFLRRRVRTWRIAKAGVVGLSTAAVVGALAFSAAQASTWTRAEPLPGRPTVHASDLGPVPSEIPTTRMSPKPSSSPSASPSPSPSGAPVVEPVPDAGASAVATDPGADGSEEPEAPEIAWPPFEPFDEGYLSWVLEAPPIGCGVPIGDLPTEPVRFTLEPNDSPADLRVTSGFTITEVAGDSYELAVGGEPEYLLFQHGRLVSNSWGQRDVAWWGATEQREDEKGNSVTYEATSPGQTWQVATSHSLALDDVSTCGERVDVFPEEYLTPLPAGEYEVVYAAPYRLVDNDTFELAYSTPYPVTLP
ncbi:hypothetical protein [Promicromonospora sp. NPDC023805]|uniref:hypothetical protein n=1 Tax=Promicromonospora sp. NPDC023805 TaxID=3154696 RepID=UPI0033DC5C3D